MTKINIIDEGKNKDKGSGKGGLYKDVTWIWEIRDPKVLSAIRNSIRKWLDSIENFAQYVARRVQSYGLIIEMSTNIYPSHEGYTLTINMKCKGIREDVLNKKWKFLKRQLEGKYGGSRTYKKMLDEYEEGEQYE